VLAQTDAVQMKQTQQQNAQMIKNIAKIKTDGGKVSTRWDELFITDWYVAYRIELYTSFPVCY